LPEIRIQGGLLNNLLQHFFAASHSNPLSFHVECGACAASQLIGGCPVARLHLKIKIKVGFPKLAF